MPKIRVIPVILLKNSSIVQSRSFCRYQIIGNPFKAVERISSWDSDELIYLEIDEPSTRTSTTIDLMSEISRRCLVPLSLGGGVRSIDDVDIRISNGADKIVINSEAIRRPQFITDCANAYGSQCVVISIDVKRTKENCWEVFSHGGTQSTSRDSIEWAREVVDRGAGEVLVNSIDRDGSMTGYDLDLFQILIPEIRVPVIPLGGAGNWSDMETLIKRTGATSVAAANVFHHKENSVFRARKYLFEAGLNVRSPSLTEFNLGQA